jgi:hypothetical protein
MKEALTGSYEGRWHVREGREDDLTPTERKRYLKSSEVIPLTLRRDGTFFHKGSAEGTWTIHESRLEFKILKMDGHTLEDMRAAAEDQGRVFRLDFLFDAFTLVLAGDALATPDDGKLLYIRYSRV